MTTVSLSRRDQCGPELAVTRSLLGYGVIAGPFYVVVSLAQALTRDGFDLTRHAWSLLANGDLGWLQITNLILAGAMIIAFAVGLRRARPDHTWAPRLVGVYGASLVAAGVFRADPAQGFPPGTPADAQGLSWPGLVHFAAGALGFGCLVVACLLLARRFAAAGARSWAIVSRVTGIAFLVAFVGLAASGGTVAGTLGFVAAVIGVSAWMSALAVHLYRTAR
jgi:hypothetical protein